MYGQAPGRAASAIALLGICAAVLAGNALWWRAEHGYPMGMSLLDSLLGAGRLQAGASVPAAGAREAAGPMLSLDIDITGDPGPEVASSRWTSSQDGVIELYARDDASIGSGGRTGYRLLDRVEAGPVVELSQASLARRSGASSSAAQVDQSVWGTLLVAVAEYDQSLGAMAKSQVTTAYAWLGRRLVEVWSATTRSEAVWNSAWDAPRELKPGADDAAGGEWARLTSLSAVQFVAGAQPSIVLRSSQKHESYSEAKDVFTTIRSRDVVQTYYWSDRWGAFVLSETTVGRDGAIAMAYPRATAAGQFGIPAGTALAVLESQSQCAEGLVFGPPHLLRVKLPDGRRCFVDEGSVVPTPSRAMV